ncbi:MAG: HEAT repeat domain-containing protein [Deltaproteobacteria bacterium]|nr:MAG: HEAT repeat domain-containing protein [Deltaproteobacteria bacterium]
MKKKLSDTDIFLRTSAADDPHREIKAELAQFLLALIQAFLSTGYYTPDHPESQRAKVGLYEDFQKLFVQKNELTFLARDEIEGKTILIEGVLPEVQDLNSLMIAGMAEMYVPRFAKYLEQKDLISLTLKNAMTPEEFTNFIDVMAEPTFGDTKDKKDKERFSRTLQERSIFNISYIYNEELLAVDRNIPWRSQIALTRLKKDFSMVPLYADLNPEELKKVRGQIVQDVVRPFQDAQAIYHVLMNSDLAVTKEFKETEIDEEMIRSLSDDLLMNVSRALITETPAQEKGDSAQEKSVALARRFASTLNQRGIEGRESVLEEYVRHKLISIEQLPKETQQRIRLERLVKKFLQDSNSFFIQIDKIQEKEKFLRVGRSLMEIIPELIHREHYEGVLEIINYYDRHSHENPHLSSQAGQILDDMVKGDVILELKGKFLIGKKDICEAIAPIFLKLGNRSLPQLVSILVRSRDHMVRKNVCEIIGQIDCSGISFVLNKLNEKGSETRSIIDILRLLGEIEVDEWMRPMANTLLSYLNHENPHIRVEALRLFSKIKGAEGKTIYLDLLDDEDIAVQKEAIQCLADVKSGTALGKFLEMLENLEELPSDKRDQIEACIYRALGLYGNIERPGMGLLEDYLLGILNRKLSPGRLRFTTGKLKALNPEVIAASCEALGNIGTDKSLGILRKLRKQKDSFWKQKAEEALTKITERERV